MLLFRWDMLLWTAFELAMLDPQLFYVANWYAQSCSPSGPNNRTMKAGSLRRAEFPGTPPICSDETGVPDFYYASGYSLMEDVFVGLVDDLRRRAFAPQACWGGGPWTMRVRRSSQPPTKLDHAVHRVHATRPDRKQHHHQKQSRPHRNIYKIPKT